MSIKHTSKKNTRNNTHVDQTHVKTEKSMIHTSLYTLQNIHNDKTHQNVLIKKVHVNIATKYTYRKYTR